MARTGRPPKPTKLKIIQGNPGKRPLPKNEPEPDPGIPSRPEWLSVEAKREWNRLAPRLASLGLLASDNDRAAFAAYCQTWAFYVDAVKDIQRNGMVQVADSGYESPRAAVGTMVKMLEKLSLYGGKFGLSPSDRVKLAVPEKKGDDPLEEFLKSKNG